MEINDSVYGKFTVKEPVLIELINSKPVQRLKGINQTGASQYVFPQNTLTRYDHCLGVMILLAKLGASVEEQIAGLLHDVPHTAFSHVVDYLFKDHSQSYHEKFHESIIMNSEIPAILAKYGCKVERILDEHNFHLLERPLPDLCADRIDYTLRDMVVCHSRTKNIPIYMKSFTVKNNEILMSDIESAKLFAEDYLFCDEEGWSHPRVIAIYQVLADAMKIALDEKIITNDNLFQNDEFVYNKMRDSGNPKIAEKLKMLNPKVFVEEDPIGYHFSAKAKSRHIDPKFIENGKVVRLSEALPEFKKRIAQHTKDFGKERFLKIVSY
jgi:HD superfamily phosphohydrolase